MNPAPKSDSSSARTAAVIQISSDGLYCEVAEARKDDSLKILERLEHPFNFAQDTFSTGKIRYDKVEKTCEVLNGFKKIIQEYRVSRVRTTATTALREASNARFIIDQINAKTHLNVEVLEDAKEKSYIYGQMLDVINRSPRYSKEDLLMAYIGTGSLGIAEFSGGSILFSQNIRIGTLKLFEILGDLQDSYDRFSMIVNEYLSSFKHPIHSLLPLKKVKRLVSCGKEIQMIARLCNAKEKDDFLSISQKAFFDAFEQIKDQTPRQVAEKYKIPETKAQILLPFFGIYRMLLDIIETDSILVIPARLTDALLREMLFKEEAKKKKADLEKTSLLSARNLGERFFYDTGHAQRVETYCLELFDGMKKIHRLGQRPRLMLRVAAILHDAGKYIHLKKHALHSFNIIKDSELPGLTSRELQVVAHVARLHSQEFLDVDNMELGPLTVEESILTAKLLAILRIADALDRSHSEKIDRIGVKAKPEEIRVVVHTARDISLETWAVEKKVDFFEEVFGYKLRLKRGKPDEKPQRTPEG
ncbi:MAG TPA: HD domain-containing protein [Thermotogota bacterium]|nr:HD domain-containing protein [Thermotogota bacterium]HRW91950.1 HD domain-containing protein [Thermotogota bacterium]